MESDTFTCNDCKRTLPVQHEGGTGYACLGSSEASPKVCYDCCAIRDKEFMRVEGRITLYLTCERKSLKTVRNQAGKVSNWPGTLSFPCSTKQGRHNIAGTRYDCWFTGLDGFLWHGVSYGENTQLVHCKRTKTIVVKGA